jgi:hypothetical protein
LAAAGGVIGNLAYDALKKIVQSLIGPKNDAKLDEIIGLDFYEENRRGLHGHPAMDDAEVVARVEHDVHLKYRILIKRGR